MPGLPILHSTDLVHWELVGHALPDLGPGFDLPSHGNGVWAPSIRYHDGLFWIFWGDPDRGIFRVTASDPRGPWSEPVLVREGMGLIDPCPLWDDDGRVWLVHAWARSRAGIKSILSLCEMNADCTACISDDELIFDGRINGNPTVEGPAQTYEMEVGAFPEGTGERCGVTVFGRGYAAVDILRNEDHTLTARYLECFNAKKGAAEEVLWESPVPDGCRGITVQVCVRESEAAMSHTEKTGADEGMLCSFALRFDGDHDAAWQETGTRPFPARAGEWVGAKSAPAGCADGCQELRSMVIAV